MLSMKLPERLVRQLPEATEEPVPGRTSEKAYEFRIQKIRGVKPRHELNSENDVARVCEGSQGRCVN